MSIVSIHGWISLITFSVVFALGISTGNVQRIQVAQTIEVKTNKDTPAYQAFQLLKGQRSESYHWIQNLNCTDCKTIELMASESSLDQGALVVPKKENYRIGKMIWLAETKIDRNDFLPAKANIENETMLAKNSIRRRTNASIGDDRERSHFQLKDLVMENSYDNFSASHNQTYETSTSPKTSKSGVIVFGTQAQNNTNNNISAKENGSSKKDPPDLHFKDPNLIQGEIELGGGLAITDKMHIMIGRMEEGQYQDYGSVDLKAANYKIHVQNLSGIIVGKLMDENDHVVGEGNFRLSDFPTTAQITSPKLTIFPPHTVAGMSGPWYEKPSNGRNAKDTVFDGNIGSGYQQASYDKSRNFKFDDIHTSSFALLRTKTENFFQTNQIVSANETTRNTLYPVSMIDSLKQILAEQNQSDEFYDRMGRARTEDLSVIWGQVSLDGTPVSGVSVEIERLPEFQAVYFNALLIPDPKLKTTSANGYFAILGTQEGLHALVAKKGYAYFSHANVFVENGAVAIADMKTSIKVEPVTLRTFDAFTGAPQIARVTLQSLTDFLDVADGSEKLFLPAINRMSLAHVQPDTRYMPAIYSYNDQDSYLHLPLVSTQWLNDMALEIQQKSGQSISSLYGTVIGFVPDEEFEVEIYGYSGQSKTQIIYFDQQGKILENQKGLQGGGFLIPNFAEDTVQIAIRGLKSGKSYLRIMPVDSQLLTVINARLENH